MASALELSTSYWDLYFHAGVESVLKTKRWRLTCCGSKVPSGEQFGQIMFRARRLFSVYPVSLEAPTASVAPPCAMPLFPLFLFSAPRLGGAQRRRLKTLDDFPLTPIEIFCSTAAVWLNPLVLRVNTLIRTKIRRINLGGYSTGHLIRKRAIRKAG